MTIHILDNHLINKIAAGEVIERPANIIKELIENSLDANATEIKIEIEDAGIAKIKIADNGDGMTREDLHLACKRHATSKIQNEQDLDNIHSLGFRGEALASIAEVSHIKIKTKTNDNPIGNMIEIEGGITLQNDKIGSPNGTIIEIHNLFYNVPARKEFLKTKEVELAHIIDIVSKYALIHKDKTITLHHNNKEIINSPATYDQLNNIIYIYGTQTAKDLVEINYTNPQITIEGFISKPNLTRANKSDQSLYINGRYIKSKIINETIYAACKTLLFTGRHPMYIINITIEPKTVNVNIHPNKLEIRLKNEKEVCENIFLAIKKAFEHQVLIPQPEFQTQEPTNNQKRESTYQLEKQKNLFIQKQVKETEYIIPKVQQKVYDANIPQTTNQNNQEKTNQFPKLNVLGQTNNMFIIAESENGILIIDQHAAEERVNYELFMNQKKNKAIITQTLLQPQIIELTPTQYQKTIQNKELLNSLGFTIEDFGNNTMKLTTIPQIFDRLKHNIIIDIINQLTNTTTGIINTEIEDRIIRFACKASVKAGEEMTQTQMKELMQKLSQCENPYTCPHGRPTTIELTITELEKKFKRTGW